MAVHVLGGAVNGDIGTQLQRPLVIRRQEGVIHRVNCAGFLGNCRNRCNIRAFHGRVGWCFGQYQACIVTHRSRDLVGLRGVGESELDAKAAQYLGAQAVSTTIGNVRNDCVVTGAQKGQHHALHRRHSGAKTNAVHATFQVIQFELKRTHRRVAGAGIRVALGQVFIDRRLNVSGRLVDRCQDRPGLGIRGNAGVNLSCGKTHIFILPKRGSECVLNL